MWDACIRIDRGVGGEGVVGEVGGGTLHQLVPNTGGRRELVATQTGIHGMRLAQ
jgi:hypothetical protein